MNWKLVFANVLSGASNGAASGLQNQTGPKVDWAGVGIVAGFGALGALIQALQTHPAVVATQVKVQTAA